MKVEEKKRGAAVKINGAMSLSSSVSYKVKKLEPTYENEKKNQKGSMGSGKR
jgi:hypothetical protein